MDSSDPLTWPTQTEKLLARKFLIFTEKSNSSNKNFFRTHPEELIFYPKEKFLPLNQKNNQFSQQKCFLYLSKKNLPENI